MSIVLSRINFIELYIIFNVKYTRHSLIKIVLKYIHIKIMINGVQTRCSLRSINAQTKAKPKSKPQIS